MEQIRSNGEARELRDEVVDLGTRYGIVTPYTSYLALEPGAATDMATGGASRDSGFVIDGATQNRTRSLPPNARKARTATGAGGGARTANAPMVMEVAPTPMPTTGAAAVRDSKRERARQESLRADEVEESAASASGAIRKLAGKTFYLREGVWTDADFKADARLPETVLVFGTDAYFELLKRERKLAEFFALGERVVVVYKGRIYRVNAAP